MPCCVVHHVSAALCRGRDTLFADVGADGVSALKVWNLNAAGGVVGAFNVQGVAWSRAAHENQVLDAAPRAVAARVRAADAEGLQALAPPGAAGFAAWAHRAARLALLPSAEHSVDLTLAHREWEVVTLAPVQRAGGVAWAALGLAEMLNSGGAVLASRLLAPPAAGGAVRAQLATRGAGRFVGYCQPAPTRVLLDGAAEPLLFRHDREDGRIELELPGPVGNVTVVWAGA